MTKRQKKDKKTKGQRPKREINIVMSGQFRTLAMFFFSSKTILVLPEKNISKIFPNIAKRK